MLDMSESNGMTGMGAATQLRMKIFLRSPLRCELLTRLVRLLDRVEGEQVLEMVVDDAMSAGLRHANDGGGAAWHSATISEQHVELLSETGGAAVQVNELPVLPFEDGSFDAVVMSEMLEYVEDPAALMEEVHRVLAPKTRLVLHVRRKRRTVIGFFRRLARLTDPTRPLLHPGFTPAELFDALKDGFDVRDTVMYGRFFSEFADLLVELFAGVIPWSCEPAALTENRLRRALTVYTAFTPVFWLARILDAIFFFLPAHHLVVRAQRRMLWVPRMTPRLRDGRNIAEATLGYKIGVSSFD
jgi:SAM-dependent methyltransferase